MILPRDDTETTSLRTTRVASKLLKVSPAFETYWRFAVERQLIYFRRLRGDQFWTLDPILLQHRFTNVYRAADRVSQFLIGDVIPKSRQCHRDIVFRVLLFKLFNRIETWRLLEESIGEIRAADFCVERYAPLMENARKRGERLYSAAYIMPSPNLGAERKHSNHLALLAMILRDRIPDKLVQATSLAELYRELRDIPSLGPFLAFQFAIDLNYTPLFSFNEMDFVVPGPGAVNGIRKCFIETGGFSDSDIIAFMADSAAAEFKRLGLPFPSLWGRPLQLIDCQNLFCEVDKYSRLAHPEIRAASGRTRIKQRFRSGAGPIPAPAFPARWNLNTSSRPSVPYVDFSQSA